MSPGFHRWHYHCFRRLLVSPNSACHDECNCGSRNRPEGSYDGGYDLRIQPTSPSLAPADDVRVWQERTRSRGA